MKRNNLSPHSAPGQSALRGSRSYQALALLFGAALCLVGFQQAAAAPAVWTGASGTDTNWSNGLNWDINTPPGTADDVFFSAGGVVYDTSINNAVDGSTTINSLSYTQTGASTYQNTFIGDAQALTIYNTTTTNAVFVGSGVDSGNVDTLATISGPNGALDVTASNGVFKVRQGGLTHFAGTASLDLSGLSNATITVRSLLVAGDGSNALDENGGRPADRPSGTLKLAQTSTLNILAVASANPPGLTVGYTIGNNSQVGSSLVLGETNYIYSDSGFAVGLVRVPGQMTFNAAFPSAYAVFRDLAGTGRQSKWLIGDASLGASPWGAPTVGTVDFSAGAGLSGLVDAKVEQLIVGRSKTTSEAGGTPTGAQAIGTLTFDAGMVDVNTAVIGYQVQDYSPQVQGTVNVKSKDGVPAQLLVNSSMQLGRFMAADYTNGMSSAILNIDGGAVTVNGNITTTTSALNPDNDSEINLGYGGSLYVKGTVGPLKQLSLGSVSTNILDLGTSLNPLTPVCTVSNLITSFPTYLIVSGSALDIGTIQVIKYETYALTDMSDFVAEVQGAAFGYFTNNTATLSIDLVITNTATFSWNGRTNGVNVGNWDIGTTPNWKSGASEVVYTTANNAQFDDSAQGTTSVNLTANIPPPTTIFKNTTKNYTLSGPGAITGSGGVTKTGGGSLTIANSGVNAFTALTINGGTVQLSGSADRLPTNAAVTLANVAGAALDLNSQNQAIASLGGTGPAAEVKLGTGALTVRGTASATYGGVISGNGSLIKTNSGTLILTGANTYDGGTTISNTPSTGSILIVQNTTGSALGSGPVLVGTNGLLRIGNGTAAGSVSAAVINTVGHPYTGAYGVDLNRNDNWTFTNHLAGTSQLFKNNGSAQHGTTVTIASSNSYSGLTTISSGTLRVAHPYALGTPTTPSRNWSTVIVQSTGPRLELSNNIILPERLLLPSKPGAVVGDPAIRNIHGTNILTGNITITSGGSIYCMAALAGTKLVFSNLWIGFSSFTAGTPYYDFRGDGDIEVAGGLVNGGNNTGITNSLYKEGNGTLTLWGTNAYRGPTTIARGTLILNGVINGTNGSTGTGPLGAVYRDVNINPDGTLRGHGLIATLAVTNSGTLAPGTASTIGTLTMNNTLTLLPGSTNVFRLSPTGTSASDRVAGITTVYYGGTLKLTLLPGTLIGGEVFSLFGAASYSGSFDMIELPAIDPALSWDITQLGVDGTLRVNGSLGPQSIGVAQSALGLDGNFQMSGASTLTNWNYRVLATTNVADVLSWTEVGSGVFTAGAFSFTDMDATNYPHRFYMVVAP